MVYRDTPIPDGMGPRTDAHNKSYLQNTAVGMESIHWHGIVQHIDVRKASCVRIVVHKTGLPHDRADSSIPYVHPGRGGKPIGNTEDGHQNGTATSMCDHMPKLHGMETCIQAVVCHTPWEER